MRWSERMRGLAGLAALGLMIGACDDGGAQLDPSVDMSPVDVGSDRAVVDMQPEPDAQPCAEGEIRICDRAPACRGVEVCAGGIFGPCEAAPEQCNGLDDDCDDAVDEPYPDVGEPCSAGIGACVAEGAVVCSSDGSATECDATAGAAGEESCTGVDDDCDGMVDEGFGVAEQCAVGQGACAVIGLVACADDGTARCDAEPAAAVAESCNEIDDDCDGEVDEGLGLGDACVAGLGACEAPGQVVCGLDEEAACDARPGAAGVERCSGIDEDCDGVTDEGFDLGAACRDGEGLCADTGVIVCIPDGGARCEAQVGEPGVEVCNRLDDDCDGATDEGFPVGGACAVGLGACISRGVIACDDAGDLTCDAVPAEPSAEVCNGADDDCDGLADERLNLGAPCPIGVGACAAQGRLACGAGDEPVCEGEPGLPVDEQCNAVDDDCDGVLDEGTGAGEACRLGIGACAVDGRIACQPDGGLVCSGEPGLPGDELCNDLDDDCDGAVDELFGIGRDCLLEVGGCQTVGRSICADEQPICAPVNAASQLGDGSDGELVVAAGEVVILDRGLYALTRLHVAEGGRLIAPSLDAANGSGGRVDLRVRAEAIIEPGALIDVTGLGWPGAPESAFEPREYPGAWGGSGGATGWHGRGPGAGQGGFAAPQQTVGAGGGGGHATPGAAGVLCGVDDRDFNVYDVNTDQPLPISAPPRHFSAGGAATAEPGARLSLGSGGGGGGNNHDGGQGSGGPGGAGGGALRIVAEVIVIDGEIIADGGPGGAGQGGNFVGGGGGGAGGAVHLVAAEIGFGGRISAVGGVGGEGTGGSIGGVGGDGWIRIDGAADLAGELQPEPLVGEGTCVAEAVFEHTGAAQTFTVPVGVERLHVEAWGAQAGDSESCDGGEQRQADGGLGGYVAGVVNVRPGDVLSVVVGGQPALVLGGVTPGGFNGGGAAGQYGGAGGGATDLRRGDGGLADRILVAGGGGGGNTGCPDHGAGGLGGGLIAGDGLAFQGGEPGLGGSQEAGGAAGDSNGELLGRSGGPGAGGSVAEYHFSGGGGGYFGGGNGYAVGAGGGSSYFGAAALGAVDAGVHPGHGRMIIRW